MTNYLQYIDKHIKHIMKDKFFNVTKLRDTHINNLKNRSNRIGNKARLKCLLDVIEL